MQRAVMVAWIVVLVASVVACGSDAPPPRQREPRDERPASSPTALLARAPYMGVACPQANSIACDRVGLAVWLKRPATQVTANIEGHVLLLHAGGFGGQGRAYWEGYLQPAGLRDGPLRITPDRGRLFWQGSHPKDARVLLRVRGGDGVTRRTSLRVGLHPGWG